MGVYNNESEFELFKKVANKDEEAFKELYEATYKKVYFYLYRLFQDKNTAEDVLVDTYTEVWKNAKKFRGDAKPTSWIIGIARNLAMNELKNRYDYDDIDEHLEIPSNGMMPNLVETTDRKRLLEKALSSLSMKHREILHLVFYQEFSYQEISKLLNIPINTVKTRVFYAKDALKKILNNMGVKKDEI